jgi:NADPH:quinone reductase
LAGKDSQTFHARPTDEKARLIAAVEATVWPWKASGTVRPRVEATFPLEQPSAAHLRLEAGGHVGKIVLTV